ncbi:hypothetical protein [Peterkaempfera griseoplana]|uniref:hypothetical protein n=1 Tax=Peterkaempfera griseoplana TaxID=66896 RepID=UPI0006E3C29F|nr:hypothetical protein [Peterkaempfera griseoplana]
MQALLADHVTDILARHQPPSLDELRPAPDQAAAQPFAAHLVHSTGMTYRYPDTDGTPSATATSPATTWRSSPKLPST